MRVLVAGWFSFGGMGATAGDLLARDLVCEWLDEAGRAHDIANAAPFAGGVDWRAVNPRDYREVVLVCGPCGNGWPLTELLDRFRASRLIGINLTMLEPVETWNPFDVLIERDSSGAARADISVLARVPAVPLAGVVLVHPQQEYVRGLHDEAAQAVARLLAAVDIARVDIDTRLDVNRSALRTAAQVESLIARMDVVVTTRLHGLVLALKHGVPVLAIDPVAGGAKVRRQAETIGWPHVVTADALASADLHATLTELLTPSARERAGACGRGAARAAAAVRSDFLAALRDGSA
jgi:hypothetical protein